MSTYLITGGAGFIGSHLVRRFLAEGQDVRVLDNFSSGKRENLSEVLGDIDLIEGDIRDPDTCNRACDGVEVVLHEAARPSVPLSVEAPALSHDVNINGTFNMLMAARDRGVRRFVYAASSSAYGEVDVAVKHEGIVPSPLSPYAVNKLVGEHYLRVFHACYGLETLSLRYFNVFGARQDPNSTYAAAIPAFAMAILRDEQPTVYGDGEQTRDFTFIDNVVHANVLATKASDIEGQVVNVACGEAVSVNDVIGQIAAYTNKPTNPVFGPVRAGDVKHSLADISLAQQLIGYTPQVDFGTGLKLAVDWYRNNLL